MLHNHHDKHDCDHAIKLCKHCDVCYCTKCGKEWKVYAGWNWYYPNYTLTTAPTATSPEVTYRTTSNTADLRCDHATKKG